MATPVHDRATDVFLDTLEGIVQCVQGDGEEEAQIGIRRVEFFAALLEVAPDHLILWAQNTTAGTPETVSIIAPGLREKLNLTLAIEIVQAEFHHSKNKVGGPLTEVVDIINSSNELYHKLFDVIPRVEPCKEDNGLEEEDDLEADPKDEVETKVDNLLAGADSIPERVEVKINGEHQMCWAITHSDGVMTYVPAEHPHVKHLEKLHNEGTKLTLANSFKLICKRKVAETDLKEQNLESTPPRSTCKKALQTSMEKARDDKVRNILPVIESRQAYLKRANPGLTASSILLCSLGWAKYEIEYRNRFQPKNRRQEVTHSAWELLLGPTHCTLDSAMLVNIDVHYDRYKHGCDGYDVVANKNGYLRK